MTKIDFRPGDYQFRPEPPQGDQKTSLITRILSHIPLAIVNIASFFNKMLLGLSGLFFKAEDITKSPQKTETTAKTQFVFARIINQAMESFRKTFTRTSFDSVSVGSSEFTNIRKNTAELINMFSNVDLMNPAVPQEFRLEKDRFVGFRQDLKFETQLDSARHYLEAFSRIPDSIPFSQIISDLVTKSGDFNQTVFKNFLNEKIVKLEPDDRNIVGADRFTKAQVHIGHNLFTNHFNFNLAAHIAKESVKDTLLDLLGHKLGTIAAAKQELSDKIEAIESFRSFVQENPDVDCFDQNSIQACKTAKDLSDGATAALYKILESQVLFQYKRDEERQISNLNLPDRAITTFSQRKEAVNTSILEMSQEDALGNLYDLSAYDYYNTLCSYMNEKNPDGGIANRLEAMSYVFENTQASDATLMQTMKFTVSLMDNLKGILDKEGFTTSEIIYHGTFDTSDIKKEITANKQLDDGHDLHIHIRDIKGKSTLDAAGKPLNPDRYELKLDRDGNIITEATRYRYLLMSVNDSFIELPFILKTVYKHTESECKVLVSSKGFIYNDIYLDGELMSIV